MLISVKHNYVFLCTPKCASVSIEAMLKPYCDIALLGLPAFRHTNYREYRQYIDPYLKEKAGIDSIESICMMREPLSWLKSWHKFRSRTALRNPKAHNHKNSTYGIQFSEFIEAYMLPEPPPFADVGSQFDFIKNENNEVGVDKIFLFENIGDFAIYTSKKVGRKLKIKKTNVSPKNYYKRIKYLGNKLVLRHQGTDPKVEYELSDDLLHSLHNFISNDFELYEKLKNSQ